MTTVPSTIFSSRRSPGSHLRASRTSGGMTIWYSSPSWVVVIVFVWVCLTADSIVSYLGRWCQRSPFGSNDVEQAGKPVDSYRFSGGFQELG